MTARTQEQILARFKAITDGGTDWMGFRRDVLLSAMDVETLCKAVPDGNIDVDRWVPIDPEHEAREYLTFAIGKAVDHRGISASRSVDKLREYAWLLGRDDIVQAMEDAEYEQYGVPKLKAFAVGLGWPWPADGDGWQEKALARMAEGMPCSEDCYDGCGQ
ncbi:hypothetical protein [Micromonospora sp. WMMD998]|uniref:hypothetical protein n=1 Tax=Micromonospora sp. WMMD998 TaxID=3016092 RepID=UPI00249B2C69|nr:hypothetical protein [Micromonospora sp. WMMD998]WFE41918.1 hypothetical protein O7619_27120 [Micromonospora sp. WMMD998]